MSQPIFDDINELKSLLASTALDDVPGMALADALTEVHQHEGKATLSFEFGFPSRNDPIALSGLANVLQVDESLLALSLKWKPPVVQPQNSAETVPGVKNIIAVASGKGGVGKSTTTVNLALALAYEGANVGVLDADIYGPSQAQMLGVADRRPEILAPSTMAPIEALNGINMISMGNLVTEKTPMVWRGPMVSGALQQLLRQTRWNDIDYLLIDMPPGTGDIQLTLSQSVPVSGSVIVTTPQDIALLDAQKGIEMFRKVNIPVLGVVENMSMHTCSACGHQEAIFGEHGGDKLAEDYAVDLLGRLPLALDIRLQTDDGKPPVAVDPESEVSQSYRSIARGMSGRLWQQALVGASAPEIMIVDD